MNETVKRFWGSFPKDSFTELGIPARLKRDAQSWNDWQLFCDRFGGTQNLYSTVYGLEEPANYKSAIIDKLFFEFDADEGEYSNDLKAEVIRGLDWMRDNTDFHPNLVFSGRRGIHFDIEFEPINLHYGSRCLQRMIENIEKLSGCQFICDGSRNGTAQMRRIPGSRHQKTGLFCIPVTEEEVRHLSPKQLLELAKVPRVLDYRQPKSIMLREALLTIDHQLEMKRMLERLLPPLPVAKSTPDCLAFQAASGTVKAGQRDFVLVGLVNALKEQGYDQFDAQAWLLNNWLPKNEPKPDDKDWVKYKVEYHWERNRSSCAWFSKAKLPLCDSCPVRQRIVALKAN